MKVMPTAFTNKILPNKIGSEGMLLARPAAAYMRPEINKNPKGRFTPISAGKSLKNLPGSRTISVRAEK